MGMLENFRNRSSSLGRGGIQNGRKGGGGGASEGYTPTKKGTENVLAMLLKGGWGGTDLTMNLFFPKGGSTIIVLCIWNRHKATTQKYIYWVLLDPHLELLEFHDNIPVSHSNIHSMGYLPYFVQW